MENHSCCLLPPLPSDGQALQWTFAQSKIDTGIHMGEDERAGPRIYFEIAVRSIQNSEFGIRNYRWEEVRPRLHVCMKVAKVSQRIVTQTTNNKPRTTNHEHITMIRRLFHSPSFQLLLRI